MTAAGTSRQRLAVLQPTGEVFVTGLASSYDDEFPESERLAELMTREEFDKAMSTINDALLDHWPCLPCKGFGYGCCICTLGLSLYCAATQVQEAQSRLQLQLRRLNDQKKFKSQGIQWRLERTWWRCSSFIEISVGTIDKKESSGMAEVDRVMETGGEAARNETMDDRVV